MSTCRRCNRVLKTQPWADLGIGKICSAKEAADAGEKASSTGDVIVPYDGGDIFIERLGGDEASGVRTNVPHKIKKHSPTGMNFGYGGSGPADFALNTLLMFTDEATASKMYQTFKFEYVAVRSEPRLEIPRQTIINFINANKDRD